MSMLVCFLCSVFGFCFTLYFPSKNERLRGFSEDRGTLDSIPIYSPKKISTCIHIGHPHPPIPHISQSIRQHHHAVYAYIYLAMEVLQFNPVH